MSNEPHTPGPWRAKCNKDACDFFDQHGDGWTVEGPEMVPDHERPMLKEADAYLMAAAPELLALAKEMDKWLANTSHGKDHPLRTSLQAAITKAHGQEGGAA